MQEIISFLKTDSYLLILSALIVILFIGFIIVMISNIQLKNKYRKFMQKLGNGRNLEEDLGNFMYKVDRVEKQNAQIMNFCKSLDDNLSKCIQKVGIVRYNAFKDTGSDLSFALALLDENNDGVVLNGIYSREMSNIYAKPVEKGKSTYTVSEEETQAIQKAIEANGIYKMR